jgi:hypothetical protein
MDRFAAFEQGDFDAILSSFQCREVCRGALEAASLMVCVRVFFVGNRVARVANPLGHRTWPKT